MKRLLVLVVLLVLVPAAPAGASTLCLPECAPVVVVGVPGLRWSDIGPATPTLDRLARQGGAGVLSVKAVPEVSCPADGWLTLGAGNRVIAPGIAREPCGTETEIDAAAARAANASRREGAELGAVRSALEAAGKCVSAVGPGAALVGAVDRDCAARLHELPAVMGTGSARADTASTVDRAVAELARQAGTLIVVGLSAAPGESAAHLQVALAHGPTFAPGALTSASTRRSPHVQLVDVAPTVLDLLGVAAPASMIGEPWRSVGRPPGVASLRDEALLAQGQRAVTVPFFVLLCAAQLLVLSLALWRRWWRCAEITALAGTTALGASYLANLVPWWRADQQLLALLAATAVGTALLTGVALLGRGLLARAGLACALVAAVITVDLLTGADLQLSSVAGYSPLVAGRFAGIGNVAFGVLAAASLLAAAASRRASVAALTALVVVVDGAPQWGSDVGGVLALVPAFAVLVLLLSGRAASLKRIALAGLVGAAVVTAFGIADYSRAAPERTHLGRFVGQVLEGTAGEVLLRKATANLSLLFLSPVTSLLPLLVLVLVFVVRRPPPPLSAVFEWSPAWRCGLLAVATAAGLGFLLNDSGAGVAGLAILVALPATIAVMARHARLSPIGAPAR